MLLAPPGRPRRLSFRDGPRRRASPRDEEIEPAMRNIGERLRRRCVRVSRPVCKGLAVMVLPLLAACAGSGLESPARRAAALEAEAAAHPQSAEPAFQLALLHDAQGDCDAALRDLRQALARDPNYEPALTHLARLLYETGRSAAGVRWFESRPLSAWPEAVRLDVALLLADVGRNEEARRILVDLQSGAQRDAAAANLAWLDVLEGNPNGAAERLAALHAPSPEARNNLAVLRLRAGDVDASEAILAELVQAKPDFAAARLNLALLRRHYRFDPAGAEKLEQDSTRTVAARALSDASVQELLDGVPVEDAAPPAAVEGTHGSR